MALDSTLGPEPDISDWPANPDLTLYDLQPFCEHSWWEGSGDSWPYRKLCMNPATVPIGHRAYCPDHEAAHRPTIDVDLPWGTMTIPAPPA